MSNRNNPTIAQRTVSRRTVLEWLGSGCVLSLGSAALAACGQPDQATADAGRGPGGDSATAADLGPGADLGQADSTPGGDAAASGTFPFSPGPGKQGVFKSWSVRTVDPQDLKKILASWTLSVDGLVANKRSYTFAQLTALERSNQITDFHCVEGWSVLDVPWNGVHLSEIFNQVKPSSSASHVAFHTIDGKYNESLPLAVAKESRTLLGYGVGGQTLPLAHGFPLRVVIPRLLGYKNAKFITRIELTDKPLHGFWVKGGYPYEGKVPKERLRPGKY